MNLGLVFASFVACDFYLLACGANNHVTEGNISYAWGELGWQQVLPPIGDQQGDDVSYLPSVYFPILTYGPSSSPQVFTTRPPDGTPETRIILMLKRNANLITSLSLTQHLFNIQIFQLADATVIFGCLECQISTTLAGQIMHYGFPVALAHHPDLPMVGVLFRSHENPQFHQPSNTALTWDQDIYLDSGVFKNGSITLGRSDYLGSWKLSATIFNLYGYEQ